MEMMKPLCDRKYIIHKNVHSSGCTEVNNMTNQKRHDKDQSKSDQRLVEDRRNQDEDSLDLERPLDLERRSAQERRTQAERK